MAKVAIFLFCLVIFLVVDKSVSRTVKTDCKTDKSCGENPVIKSLIGQEYCCPGGFKMKLRPPMSGRGNTVCKCSKRVGKGEEVVAKKKDVIAKVGGIIGKVGGAVANGKEGGVANGKEGRVPSWKRGSVPSWTGGLWRSRSRKCKSRHCGEGTRVTMVNGKTVCCPLGYRAIKQSRGRRREKCYCQ